MENHDAELRKWADAHAEVSRQLAAANEKIAGWEKAAESWFASPEAAQRLEGYRELALKANTAELALAAANERAGRLERDHQKARAAFLRLRKQPRQSTLDVVCDLDDLDEYFKEAPDATLHG